MTHIGLVEDDEELSRLFEKLLQKSKHKVSVFSRGEPFLEAVHNRPDSFDLVLCDYRLPDRNGLDIYHEARRLGFTNPYILMTAYGQFEVAVQALKSGIVDYLIKPLKKEILLEKVAFYLNRKHEQVELLSGRLSKKIVAESSAMKKILQKLSRVAKSRASILLTGESGTGKEVLARMLHQVSGKTASSFIAVNASAIPQTLFEAEFFGYRKGAFTDASRDHPGFARRADGGTLFLDEVGDLPLPSQAKLLRLLEDRQVQPLGSKDVHSVDFRLICATNRDLKSFVRKRKFRDDLYYRIAVVAVHIPPLRERPDDIIPLSRQILRELSREEGLEVLDYTPRAQQRLLSYPWPGNVRELRNCVYESLLATDDPWIDAKHLNLQVDLTSAAKVHPYAKAKGRFQKNYLTKLLKSTGGNVKAAAAASDLTRKALYDLMKNCGIKPRDFRKR